MVADLREMQENQWISEDRIDKPELFMKLSYLILIFQLMCDYYKIHIMPMV